MENLNHVPINTDYKPRSSDDHSIERPNDGISVYFRDLERHLIRHIREHEVVVGCVAWLTNETILQEMAKKRVAIVVQKEDFLRPDLNGGSNWRAKLRMLYDDLRCDLARFSFDNNVISDLSVCGDPMMDSVRCVGNHNQDKQPAFPRMHNKFLLFAKAFTIQESYEWDEEMRTSTREVISPVAVWTGSFNLTYNATKSFENALYLTLPEIVDAYWKEFGQIVALSEPLNWQTEWIAPEWRIGT